MLFAEKGSFEVRKIFYNYNFNFIISNAYFFLQNHIYTLVLIIFQSNNHLFQQERSIPLRMTSESLTLALVGALVFAISASSEVKPFEQQLPLSGSVCVRVLFGRVLVCVVYMCGAVCLLVSVCV